MMDTAPIAGQAGTYGVEASESSASGVSWAAVLAGAFTAAAISLILVSLGSGFGLLAVSPWSGASTSLTTLSVATAIWFIVMQWLSAGLGGYMTGRLRTKWAGLHTREVFFRDTANGFLSWAVATVIVVAFLASAAGSAISGATHVAAGAVSAGAQGATQAAAQSPDQGGPAGYFIDSLYRSDRPNANASQPEVRGETTRILAMGVRNGGVSPADRTYLAQLVAAHTGLSPDDAAKRVDSVIGEIDAAEAKARQAADVARKTGATVSIVTGLSMLIGAFIACVAAALGGRWRDEYRI